MPIYEYECEECGKVHEAWQKISDPPLKTCEHCRGKLHKIISRSTFHLKGSGWYATDYGGKSGAASSGGSGNAGNKSAEGDTSNKKEETGKEKPASD